MNIENTQPTITALEFALLNKIAFSEYQPVNGHRPESFQDTSHVWIKYIVEAASERGVFSSLRRKKMVEWGIGDEIILNNGFTPTKMHTCALTELGFNMWKAGIYRGSEK